MMSGKSFWACLAMAVLVVAGCGRGSRTEKVPDGAGQPIADAATPAAEAAKPIADAATPAAEAAKPAAEAAKPAPETAKPTAEAAKPADTAAPGGKPASGPTGGPGGPVKERDRLLVRIQISIYRGALDMYEVDLGSYPTTKQGLEALVKRPADLDEKKSPWHGPYTAELPKDPWGHDYQYRFPAKRGNPQQVEIWSNGPDGQSDTPDDIGTWGEDSDAGGVKVSVEKAPAVPEKAPPPAPELPKTPPADLPNSPSPK
jgi:general secretion pathway protein G